MSTDKNKKVVRHWIEEIIAQKKLGSLGDALHDEIRHHSAARGKPWTTVIKGLRAAEKDYGVFFRDHPKWECKIQDIFGEGDKIVARFLVYENGEHNANSIAIYRISEGKIIDEWWCSRQIEDGK